LNASWIFSKSQEHWFFLEKWSQKKEGNEPNAQDKWDFVKKKKKNN
jgi:hypothetical protein